MDFLEKKKTKKKRQGLVGLSDGFYPYFDFAKFTSCGVKQHILSFANKIDIEKTCGNPLEKVRNYFMITHFLR